MTIPYNFLPTIIPEIYRISHLFYDWPRANPLFSREGAAWARRGPPCRQGSPRGGGELYPRGGGRTWRHAGLGVPRG